MEQQVRRGRPLAAWAVVASLALIVQPVMFVVRVRDGLPFEAASNLALLIAPAVGAVIVSRLPANRIGWLLLAIGVFQQVGMLINEDRFAWKTSGRPSGWLAAASDELAILMVASVAALVVVFPDGRPRHRIGRVAAWAIGATVAATTVLSLAGPFPAGSHDPVSHPVGWTALAPSSLLGGVLLAAVPFGLLLGVVGGVATSVARWRRGSQVERAQIGWLLYPLVVGLMIVGAVLMGGLFVDVPAGVTQLLPAPFAIGVPVGVGVALLRYRLFDIRILMNRTALYLALTLGLAATYMASVGVLGVVVIGRADWAPPVLAAGVLAVVFQPLRSRLQRAADRRLFGDRRDPYQAVAKLQERVAEVDEPADVARAVAEGVAAALRVPYVAVEIDDAAITEVGESGPSPVRYEVRHAGQRIGQLIVAPRSHSETFNVADDALLRHFADQAGLALAAASLAKDLRASNQHLLGAIADERRRLRRDLHDELGPRLTGVGFAIEAARRNAEGSEAALLAQAGLDVREAVAGIRRMARGLRPPELDELGLAGALRLSASRLAASGLIMDVSLPDDLPMLDPAVEAAVLRIADEAMTNVARHAGATHCALSVTVGASTVLDVSDDGGGIAPGAPIGIGLRSMRERAAEAGGTCEIGTGPAGAGTCVCATFPSRAT